MIESNPLTAESDPIWIREHLRQHHAVATAHEVVIDRLVDLHTHDHSKRRGGVWNNHTHRAPEPKREKLYIAGPMRGFPCFNFPAFDDAASKLEAAGYSPISPAQMDRDAFGWGVCPDENVMEGFSVADALRRDFQAILDADGIVLLPGWEKSEGATAERFVAENTGKKVYLYTEPQPNEWRIELAPPWDPGLCAVKPAETATANLPEGEVRVTDPSTGGAKGQKLARFDLLPSDALWVVAEHYGKGAQKYEERNWERGYAWSLSYGALQRHLNQFWNGEDIDAETGGPHLAAAAFHVLGLLAFLLRGAGTDDRPSK